MKTNLSVIICTHNPRFEYFDRVLNALKGQTLPLEQWELVIIDNASVEPLCERVDLNWHPHVASKWNHALVDFMMPTLADLT